MCTYRYLTTLQLSLISTRSATLCHWQKCLWGWVHLGFQTYRPHFTEQLIWGISNVIIFPLCGRLCPRDASGSACTGLAINFTIDHSYINTCYMYILWPCTTSIFPLVVSTMINYWALSLFSRVHSLSCFVLFFLVHMVTSHSSNNCPDKAIVGWYLWSHYILSLFIVVLCMVFFVVHKLL